MTAKVILSSKSIIGANALISVDGIKNVPAKIDTGADSSAIWVSDVEVLKNNHLSFKLFGPKSPFYTGKTIETKDYKVVVTRSSHGDEKIFYRTFLPIVLGGRQIRTLFTLADRSHNNFPVLIGKRTIRGKFIVDVAKKAVIPKKNPKSNHLNQELKKNPYQFHQKYIKNNKGIKK